MASHARKQTPIFLEVPNRKRTHKPLLEVKTFQGYPDDQKDASSGEMISRAGLLSRRKI